MTSSDEVLNRSEQDMRRGSVSKKMLFDAFVKTRQRQQECEDMLNKRSTQMTSDLETLLDSNFSPFLDVISDLKVKFEALHTSFMKLQPAYCDLKRTKDDDFENICEEAEQRKTQISRCLRSQGDERRFSV